MRQTIIFQILCRAVTNLAQQKFGSTAQVAYNLREDVLKSYILSLTLDKKFRENNLAFADIFRYLGGVAVKPVMKNNGLYRLCYGGHSSVPI